MKRRLVDLIACPVCASHFECETFEGTDDELIDGLLSCAGCDAVFPIHRGIPRLVVDPPYNDPEFDERYRDRAVSGPTRADAEHLGSGAAARLLEVKEATAASFGYEWNTYSRFGWDGKHPGETGEARRAIERSVFLDKALLDPSEVEGSLILDAGCGNGRYVYQAAEMGAEVIGIDLSGAVEAAYANVGSHPNVHIVQGDLFQLPFRPGTFDRIFSIGVLMHTGDAPAAFAGLAKRLKPDGTVSIHVYRRGNAIYEFLDDRIRRRTTRMDHKRLMRLSERAEIAPKALWHTRRVTFGKPVLYSLLNCFVRLEFGHHYIFDWYSAPVATHHTYPEVFGWYERAGLQVVRDRSRRKDPIRRMLKSPAGGVTVKGVAR